MTHEKDVQFKGYHSFRADDGSEYGSFEVFYYDSDPDPEYFTTKGWYWWSCFPGCLPDADPNGPYPEAEGAYLDAMEGRGTLDAKDDEDASDGEFEQREAYLQRLAADIGPEDIEGDEPAGYSDFKPDSLEGH